MTMQRVVEVWENKLLVLAEPKRWLILLLCIVVFAVGGWASSGAADVDYVHQDVTGIQTGIICVAAVFHRAGDLRPSVFCITSIKQTLVSFGLHCWLIESSELRHSELSGGCCCWAAVIQKKKKEEEEKKKKKKKEKEEEEEKKGHAKQSELKLVTASRLLSPGPTSV